MPVSVSSSRHPCALTMRLTGCFAFTSCSSSRTAYGAPDAPVTAITSGSFFDVAHVLQHPLREHEAEEGEADHAVHGEERRVELREIARAHEPVLIEQQRRHGDHAREIDPSRAHAESHRRERTSHRAPRAAAARDRDPARLADQRGDRMQIDARGRSRRPAARTGCRSRRPSSSPPPRAARAPTRARSTRRSPRDSRPPARCRGRARARGARDA